MQELTKAEQELADKEYEIIEAPEDGSEIPAVLDPKQELTESEIRKLRKQYVTVQHPKVLVCKHTLDLSRQPKHRNCQHCWWAWLNNHGEIVQQLDEMHTSGQDALIIQLQGEKFFKRFLQFMSTVANFKLEAEAQGSIQEINEQDTIGPSSSIGSSGTSTTN
jgi:hypothetical protein